MKYFCFAIGIFGSIYYFAIGDITDGFLIWVSIGLILFVWYTVVDAAQRVTRAFGRDTYNITQERYDLSNDDPTRPNENIPTIIEIGRQYRRKP